MSGQQTESKEELKTGAGHKLARRAGIFNALLAYLWQEKMWWMIPMVVVLVAFALLAAVAGSAGIAPFVYTLF